MYIVPTLGVGLQCSGRVLKKYSVRYFVLTLKTENIPEAEFGKCTGSKSYIFYNKLINFKVICKYKNLNYNFIH